MNQIRIGQLKLSCRALQEHSEAPGPEVLAVQPDLLRGLPEGAPQSSQPTLDRAVPGLECNGWNCEFLMAVPACKFADKTTIRVEPKGQRLEYQANLGLVVKPASVSGPPIFPIADINYEGF